MTLADFLRDKNTRVAPSPDFARLYLGGTGAPTAATPTMNRLLTIMSISRTLLPLLYALTSLAQDKIMPPALVIDTNLIDTFFWATASNSVAESLSSNVVETNYDQSVSVTLIWSYSGPTGLTYNLYEWDKFNGTNVHTGITSTSVVWPPSPPSNVCITVTCRGTGDVYQSSSLQTPWVRTMTNVTGTVFVRTNPSTAFNQYWRGPGMLITRRWFN